MKNVSLLVWMTQLGFSVAFPLAGFVLLGVWLHRRFSLGSWVVILCSLVGVICAVAGFRNSLRAMKRMAEDETADKPPVSYNDHD